MGTYCITGGASGIGAGIVDRLRSDQHEVFTVDLRNADIEADLSTPKGRDAAIEAIRAKAPGGLDGFVPCAGIGPHVQPISLIPRVNFFGAVALTDALCPDLAKRKGSVVMISSNSSRMGEADPVLERVQPALLARLSGNGPADCSYVSLQTLRYKAVFGWL